MTESSVLLRRVLLFCSMLAAGCGSAGGAGDEVDQSADEALRSRSCPALAALSVSGPVSAASDNGQDVQPGQTAILRLSMSSTRQVDYPYLIVTSSSAGVSFPQGNQAGPQVYATLPSQTTEQSISFAVAASVMPGTKLAFTAYPSSLSCNGVKGAPFKFTVTVGGGASACPILANMSVCEPSVTDNNGNPHAISAGGTGQLSVKLSSSAYADYPNVFITSSSPGVTFPYGNTSGPQLFAILPKQSVQQGVTFSVASNVARGTKLSFSAAPASLTCAGEHGKPIEFSITTQ